MSDLNEQYMRRALTLARKGVGRTSPNPAVGCVIVRDNTVVGEGWHRKAGTPHAEVYALRQAGALACGADVYVTLEPCSHFGKTPPCADALVEARVGRVFVGMIDPNPKVAGSGVAKLRTAGIEVIQGLLESDCRSINRPFIKQVTTGIPYVTLKSAMTLDGRTGTASGDSRWVTGERARRMVHRLRGIHDAIMVGVGTVIADNPLLTCRVRGGHDPLRVIVDSSLRIPATSEVLNVASKASTLIATISADSAKIAALQALGAVILHCNARDGRVDLHDLVQRLGRRGVQSILLEGGAELAGAMLLEQLIDRCIFFYAPKLVGGDGVGLFCGMGVERMADAIRLSEVSVGKIGEDIFVQGEPAY